MATFIDKVAEELCSAFSLERSAGSTKQIYLHGNEVCIDLAWICHEGVSVDLTFRRRAVMPVLFVGVDDLDNIATEIRERILLVSSALESFAMIRDEADAKEEVSVVPKIAGGVAR